MPLWGETDTANDSPKYLSTAEEAKTFFVDTTEVQVASNIAKGIKTPGWGTYSTYVDANGNTRHKVEPYVVMKVSANVAGDAGMTGNTAIEDQTVADA